MTYRMRIFTVDQFTKNNYSLSLKYFECPFERSPRIIIPYMGISMSMFEIEKKKGMNLKPEIGVKFNTSFLTSIQPVSLSLNVSYGYHIPISNSDKYIYGRNDITAMAALSIDLWDIKRMYKRWKHPRKQST